MPLKGVTMHIKFIDFKLLIKIVADTLRSSQWQEKVKLDQYLVNCFKIYNNELLFVSLYFTLHWSFLVGIGTAFYGYMRILNALL